MPVGGKISAALDYPVLDHLLRIEERRYTGDHCDALLRLQAAAQTCDVEIWVTETLSVEMAHGVMDCDVTLRRQAEANDDAKYRIARNMRARRLRYPCSKYDDRFSLFELSLRYEGHDWQAANALEERLLAVRGVSPGDARHLVCCAYPFNAEDTTCRPTMHWFISEDRALIDGVKSAVARGQLPELAHLAFGSANDFVRANLDRR